MTVKPLAVQHLEFLSLRGGCTGSSASNHVNMPHCEKSHVVAYISETVSETQVSDPGSLGPFVGIQHSEGQYLLHHS